MVFHIKVLGSKVLVYFNLKVNKMFFLKIQDLFFQGDCKKKEDLEIKILECSHLNVIQRILTLSAAVVKVVKQQFIEILVCVCVCAHEGRVI